MENSSRNPVRRRRLLLLLPDALGGRGGIAHFNRTLMRALAERDDLELVALALHAADPEPAPARVEWRIPAPGSKVGFAVAAALAAVRQRPDLIVSGLIGFAPLAALLARASGARLWTCTHGIEAWSRPSFADAAALRRSDLVTCVSDYTRERLLDWCAIDPDRVRVLHNTIDFERFTPGPKSASLVERYDTDGRRVLLSVGRLRREDRTKGFDHVIPLLPELQRRVGPIRYIVAGSGPDGAYLTRLAEEAGVAECLVLTGYVAPDEMAAHYRLADVFVMPSRQEGFGVVFLEALACGCPVVAGDSDGSREPLAGGAWGHLANVLDRDELTSSLVAALAGACVPTRAALEEKFGTAGFTQRVSELVGSILGSSAKPPARRASKKHELASEGVAGCSRGPRSPTGD